MSDLGNALALAHDARERLGTLRARVIRWRHDERWPQAFERAHERLGDAAIAAWSADAAAKVVPPSTTVTRLWVDGERMRVETEGEPGPDSALTVVVGTRVWSYVPGRGAFTGEAPAGHAPGAVAMLLDPLPLLASLRLEVQGTVRWESRPAVELSGTLRPGMGHRLFGAGLVDWADRCDLLLDAERGVLLRAAAMLQDQPFAVAEIRELAFDEPLNPALFRFEPPPGVPVVPLSG